MKHLFSVAIAALSLTGTIKAGAQGMAVNTSGASANASSILDVQSTTQGMLLPRMTTAQRNAISSPATGLMIYQTDGTTGFYYWSGAAWTAVGGGGSGTVTSVSSANLTPLFTSSVATSTTTPAISYTMSPAASFTVLTNSTNAIGAVGYGKVVPGALFFTSGSASNGNFYQGDGTWAAPFTLTTTGTSGAATFSSGTLNIPNYATGGATFGTIQTKGVSYAMVNGDQVVNCTTAPITITLPHAVGPSYPKGAIIYIIETTGAGLVTLNKNGADVGIFFPGTSGAGTGWTIQQYANLVSDGAGTWYSVSSY